MVDHTEPLRHEARTKPARAPVAIGSRRRFGLRRAGLTALAFLFTLVALAAVLAAGVFVMLTTGTITVDLSGQIARALNDRVGGGYAFSLGSTAIQETSNGPSLSLGGFAVRDGRGRTVITAPHASLSIDPLAVLFGKVVPKRLELQDLTLRLERLADGTVAVSAGADQTTDVKLSNLASTLSPPGAPAAGATEPAAAPAGTGPASAVPAPASAVALPTRVASAVAAASDLLVGDKGLLRAVDRLGIRNGTLVVDDKLRGTSITYHDVSFDLDREDGGGVYAQLGATGPAGHWGLVARAHRSNDGSRAVDLAADHLSSDELLLAAGLRAAKFETDMPLSFSLSAEIGPDGRLLRAGGPLSFGAGYFKLDDPDHEPAMVDRFETMLTMDPATGVLDFGKGILTADQTRFDFGVTVTPPKPSVASDPWTFGGHATGVFGPERPGEQPIPFDNIAFSARYLPAAGRIVMDDARAHGPDVDFRMNATVQTNETGFLVTSEMNMGRMPGQVVFRLWPNWVAAPVRQWLLRNLHGGTFEYGHGRLGLTNVDLDRMRDQHAVPSDHVHIDFGVTNGNLSFLDGVPPLRGLEGTGVLTGDSFAFKATKAEMEVSPGHKLLATDGSFVVPSTEPKPTPAQIGMHVTGQIDALADLMSRDALKSFADVPIDTSQVAGSFDGHLTIGLTLGKNVPRDQTQIGVVATVKDFSAAKLIGKEGLQGATLNVVADRNGIRAKGEGRMFNAPAAIELHKPAGGGPSEATLTLSIDEAARQKAGFGFGRSITGPITAKIATELTGGQSSRAAVQLDFSRCAFDSPIPGLKKAAGRPSKATFNVVTENGRSALDQIVFDSGSSAIRGSAVLDQNGGLVSAALSQMRLSPGDDARVEVARAGEGLKVVVRASNIDARPFLKYATGNESGPSDNVGRDLDLDLHASLLTGQNQQAVSGVEMRLIKHGAQVRRLQISGRLGKGPITATTAPGPSGGVTITAKDAGGVLSFLDLYNRMEGGQLDATLRFGENRMDGTAIVHNFTIREDPSIKKLAQEEIPSGRTNSGARIDASAVSFTKLEAVFSRVGNKVEVEKGAMYGPQLGATIQGTIDFGRDQVALNGTFVPLYGINNLFSRIPVLGMLLGGGANEGLFALDYRIVGSASKPVMSFNPLSALAPGFLRKIFGAIDNAAQQSLGDGKDQALPPNFPE